MQLTYIHFDCVIISLLIKGNDLSESSYSIIKQRIYANWDIIMNIT